MNSNNKMLAINTMILGIGQFIPKIIAIFTLPILTKIFSTEEFGIYDLIISFSSLFLPIMTLLIQQAVFRFLISEKDKNKASSYITSSIIFVTILSFVTLLITCVINYFIGFDLKIILLAFAVYFFGAIYDLFAQICRGFGKNIYYSIAVTIYSIINMLLLLFLILINIMNIYSVLLLVAISYMFSCVYLFFKLKINKYFEMKSFSINVIKEFLKYSVPIIPSSISLWVVNLSDRFLILYFLGAGLSGIYAAASKIPNLLGTVVNVFNLAWTEVAARSSKEKDKERYYSDLFYNLYSFVFGILFFLITFSPWMYKLLIDEKFSDGFYQMPILFVGILINTFVSFYGGIYISLKKTKQVGISSLIGGILNVIINILFIEKYGLYVASISTVVSYLIICIYRSVELKKFINITYKKKKMLLGISLLVLVLINFYMNSMWFFLLNLIITLIYNLFFNEFLKFLLNKIIFKREYKYEI